MIEDSQDIKKVLFVDDEINILKSIRREFFDADFEVLIATGGLEGLKILESEKVDLVVSDVKMPQMDGIQFLTQVKDKYPKIHRIILSGFVEQSSVMSSIIKGIAHSFFAKPWDTKILNKTIQHFLELKNILNQKKLLEIINNIDKLPTLPNTYQKLLEMINKDKSIKEIAQFVEKDASMSTRILKIANSAFYGALTLSSIERAIIHLGVNIIKDMVLAVSISDQIKVSPTKQKYIMAIFEQSALVSNVIRKIYKIAFDKSLEEIYSSVGITFNIGKIILLQYFSEQFDQILNMCQQNKSLDFYQSELELGYENATHAEIGSYFLSWWNLPVVNVETAMFHHTPERSVGQYKDIVNITAIANSLVKYAISPEMKINLDILSIMNQYISKMDMEVLINDIKGAKNA